MAPAELHEVDQVLLRTGAQLQGWQVCALYLGAQTSTNLRLGPQQLLETIFGPEVVFETVDQVNATVGPLMLLWNRLVEDHRRGRVRLSKLDSAGPIELVQLAQVAVRREQEIEWYLRGIEAGGDTPTDFGDSGIAALEDLDEFRGLAAGISEQLRCETVSEVELGEISQMLDQLKTDTEEVIEDLMTISDGVRRRAIAEARGQAPARSVKVGRNEPCPCGSGRKWKRCCGAAS